MKEGFTLIELLAVIVILSIIALISTPIIIGLIEDAREETFKDSAYGVVKAGEIFYAQELINGDNKGVVFTYTDGVESPSIDGKNLNYSGTKSESGTILVDRQGTVAIAIHNGTYCAEKGFSESEVTISNKSNEECTIPFQCGDVLYDLRDAERYTTVKIGEQCWMAENLRYTGNGCLENDWDINWPYDACDTHTSLEGSDQYRNWTEPQVLYQWEAAMNENIENSQGLCTNGWHIPTYEEWEALISSVGFNPGYSLKAESPNWNGSNGSGFKGLPAGGRDAHSSLGNVGANGNWWSSSSSGTSAWRYKMYSTGSSVLREELLHAYGFSVRCLLGQ
jgi:uncharacterized protein (TIGR02145 family)/prepilin-type N-terminal cleavage/methylation domain-containing protein